MFSQSNSNATRIVAVGVALVMLTTATFAGTDARGGHGKPRKAKDITTIRVLPGSSITRGQVSPSLDAGRASAPAFAISLRTPTLDQRTVSSFGYAGSVDLAMNADSGAFLSPTVQSAFSGRLPKLLDRASFSVTRDGESGLQTSCSWSFEF